MLLSSAAPTAQAATEITESGFTANWAASAGATNYLLDVAMDSGFANFVEGYQDLSCGDGVAAPVTGLSAGSNYYYRVRAQNSGGTSANSGAMAVSAVPAAWPQAESSSAADKSIGIVFFISHHSTFFSASSIGTRMMRRYSSTATTA